MNKVAIGITVGIIVAFISIFSMFKDSEPEITTSPVKSEIQHITTEELKVKMKKVSEHTIYIDVREDFEYAEGHISGMQNYPLSTLSESYSSIPIDSEVVIICRSGNRSMKAAKFLKSKGFTTIVNVKGGMSSWDGPTTK